MKKTNSIIFILITLIILVALNFFVLPLADNLFEPSDNGGLVELVDNYWGLLSLYMFILCIVVIGVVLNIKIFLKKSTMPYYVSIPIIAIVFLNILVVGCFYVFSAIFIWAIIIYGIPVLFSILLISIIVGIYLEKRKCRE